MPLPSKPSGRPALASARIGSGEVTRFVVTGVSGALGSRVIEHLMRRKGVKVLALLREGSKIRTHHKEGIEYKRVDFLDHDSCEKAIRRFHPECIIHCAASGVQIPKPHWFELIRFNVDATIRLCECVAQQGDCRFVFISTGLAYRDTGRPLTEDDALNTQHPYGASKAAADILLRAAAVEFGVPLSVLRPFSFTGINDDGRRLFPALLRAAEQGAEIDLSPGTQVRDHCAVDDIVEGVIKAAVSREERTLGVFNLGSGADIPLREMVERVLDDLRIDVKLRWGGRGFSRFEPMHLVADTTAARTRLRWKARIALSYAVWELAATSFPKLKAKKPRKYV